jgi:hypothetical protein
LLLKGFFCLDIIINFGVRIYRYHRNRAKNGHFQVKKAENALCPILVRILVKGQLRHYLARLARRSRCFSRSIETLRRLVKLFVYAWNWRQLHRRLHPRYPAHVIHFV